MGKDEKGGIVYRSDYGVYGWRGTLRITFSLIGVLCALIAIVCFSVIFKNFHCVAWGAVCGVVASITFAMHIMVRRDIESKVNLETFTRLSWCGLLGFIAGLAGFFAYLYKGISTHEHGVQLRGYYIVCVWTGMTFKWGLVLLLYSRMYRKRLARLFCGTNNDPMI